MLSITSLPRTILEDIALYTVGPLGPPADLVPLLLTSRLFHDSLSLDACPNLYARVFRYKFDVSAASRRFGRQATYTSTLARQLVVYSHALKALRALADPAATLDAPALLDALWSAFLIMVENDGRNAVQLLEYAAVDRLLDRFVREQLWRRTHHGWPQGDPAAALVLWLLWLTADPDQVQKESDAQRKELMDRVRPFVINPIRYPAFHAAAQHYAYPLPLASSPVSPAPAASQTAHGPAPACYPGTLNPTTSPACVRWHFGTSLRLCAPLASIAARLLYLARSEAAGVRVPEDWPEDRADAIALGHTWVRPTKADLREFNAHRAAVPPGRGAWEREKAALSTRWDDDWLRWRYCRDMRFTAPPRLPYTPGSLTGSFFGRSLMPDDRQYFDMLGRPRYKPAHPAMNIVPLSFTLREYVPTDQPAQPLPGPALGADEHAWVPPAAVTPRGNGVGDTNGTGTGNGRTLDLAGHAYQLCSAHERRVCPRDEARRCGYGDDAVCCGACESRRAARRRAVEQVQDGEARASEARTLRRSARIAARTAGGAQANVNGVATVDSGVVHPERSLAGAATAVDIDAVVAAEMRQMVDEEGWSACDSDLGSGESERCTGVQDVVLVGETAPRHAQAWHRFTLRGRVRAWDGLCVLVSTHAGGQLPTLVYRGYVVGGGASGGASATEGSENGGGCFVGAWRSLGAVAGLHVEGPFVASRMRVDGGGES